MLPTLLLLLACGPKPSPVEPAPTAVPDPAPVVDPAPKPEPLRCGGIAGLRCPVPLVCVDDPDDSCEPGGGADCIGRCVPAEEAPDRPGLRRPVSDDPEACKRIRFRCEEGQVPYVDASGCGCETATNKPL